MVAARGIGDPPSPSDASTVEQLTERLRALQVWSGMSYRAIHRELVHLRSLRRVPELPVLNTVYRCFQPGRVRLDVDLVVDIAQLLLGDEAAANVWRQACWVVAGLGSAAAIVSVADTWPADLSSFTGRDADLQSIVERENDGRPGVLISGMPGVGKTWLAVRAGHLLMARGRFGRLRLAVDLRGYDPDRPPADPNAVLDCFLRRLGMPGDQIQHLSMADRTAKFRQLLAGRNALILLDNAVSAEQVRPLLPEDPGCFVLITSRRSLSDLSSVRHLSLDILSLDEAVSVLRLAADRGMVHVESEIAADIAELLGRLPLALDLVASRIQVSPDWTLADHIERLLHHRRSLRLDSGVEVAISLSYRDLPADQRRAFRLLALHPGGDLTPPAAAALTGTSVDEAHRQLDQLTAASLLQCPEPGRYRFHDLIRTYAAGRVHDEDAAGARRASLARLSDHYLHTAGLAMDLIYPHERNRRPRIPTPATTVLTLPDPAAARGWLDVERANLLAVAIQTACDGSSVGAFSAILHRHLAVTGRYPDGQMLHQHAITAAARSGDHADEAAALLRLAELNVRTGEYDQAIDHAQRALDLAEGDVGRKIEGGASMYLGLAYQMTGRYERATDHYLRALARCREVGNRVGEASALGNLGVVSQLTGRYEQAAGYHRQALVAFDDLGAVEDKARALDNIGAIHQLFGRYEQATDYHRQALTLFLDADALEGQACAHDHLGVVCQLTGRYEQAADHHRQALALSRKIGDRDDEARALNNLGDLCRRTGRHEQAVDHYQLALSRYRDLGDPHGQARALNGLGEVARAAGDPARALAAHAEAHQHASKIGQRHEQARADRGLGHAHHDLGDAERARVQWRQALALYEELGVPEANEVRTHLAAQDDTLRG